MDNLRMVAERKKLGLSQKELADKLKVSQKSISKYERGTRRPSYETLAEMASIFGVSVDFLLGLDREESNGIASELGYSTDDEDAVTFPHKLAIQLNYKDTTIQELADNINVSQKKVLSWLTGKSNDYSNYYKELSDYFNVQEFYWTTPHAISPGIVLNANEYILVLLMREYLKNGAFNDLYGSLEDYFPGVSIAHTTEEKKLLSTFRELNEDNQDIIVGEAKKYLKEQRYESVAADQPCGDNNSKKSYPSSGTEGIA